jgi:hypothetical protein
MRTEAEYIVDNRNQATIGEHIADLEIFVRAVVNCKVCELVKRL